MDDALLPRNTAALRALLDKGVTMPVPLTVEIGDEVDVEHVSGDGVVIHPGARIRGASTVISAGCELGREGPVTIEDCRLGRGVALKGGYAARATFLDGANLGLGHHVREGCLLEEESGGAHCVGLKQTILMPFVTLGSLINFCDCLMAGGTSRTEHSEVGSSYIHFNFTPGGDKTTPSLFGDVPRGVLLREPPIFLGGQGGAVGPVRTAYGAVVAAGSVLRSDIREERSLTIVGPPPAMTQRDFTGREYRGINRLVAKNLDYLASLDALEAWYAEVRLPFFAAQGALGVLVGEGAREAIAAGRRERITRLLALAGRMDPGQAPQAAFAAHAQALTEIFGGSYAAVPESLSTHAASTAAAGAPYVEAIRALPDDLVNAGQHWLAGIIEDRWTDVEALLPGVARLRHREG
ncbi:UDP-N-acetylglucosamine pyrophosphorylase [Nostocoides australiense]